MPSSERFEKILNASKKIENFTSKKAIGDLYHEKI